jgi:hypothetical protein
MMNQPHQSRTNVQPVNLSAEQRHLAITQLSARIDEMTPMLHEAGKEGNTKRVIQLSQHIENVRAIVKALYL